MSRLILSLGVFLLSTCVFADTDSKWYQLEIIVFQQINQERLHEENWPEHIEYNALNEQAINLIPINSNRPNPPATLDQAYQALPNGDMQLSQLANNLSNESTYRLLNHIAWRQPMTNANNPPRIRLTGGEVVGHKTNDRINIGRRQDAGNDSLNARSGSQNDEIFELDGIIELSQSIYPHLDVDLILSQRNNGRGQALNSTPATRSNTYYPNHPYLSMPVIDDDPFPGLDQYRLSKSERVLLDKPYYFDHPLFGMIVLINEYTPPEPAEILETTQLEEPSTSPIQ